jgi:hypothetical protein
MKNGMADGEIRNLWIGIYMSFRINSASACFEDGFCMLGIKVDCRSAGKASVIK